MKFSQLQLPGLLAIALVFSMTFIGCGKKVKYQDQILTGKIAGVDWTLASGSASEAFSDTEMSIDMFMEMDTNLCDFTSPDGNKVLFTIEKTVGEYELGLLKQTVTMYDGTTNFVAIKGAVEILSVDEVAGTVEGRMDIKADNDNFLNGNFTLTWCP